MVFESLINPIKAEKKPWDMFFIGMLYSSIAVILSLFVFREHASLVMIFLTVLASVPVIYGAIRIEEKKDLVIKEELLLMKEHGKALSFFMFLFLGFVISFMLWYCFLPAELRTALFDVQTDEINRIETSGAVGSAIDIFSTFGRILINNLWVMVFSLLFSFFYGVGSIFILTWNASVLGAAIGMFVGRSAMSHFFTVPLGILRYLIHGVPEMLAYFTAGLAGGIISMAIIRHDFGTEKFRNILVDSIDLVLLSVAILFGAALLEVLVTPLFF